MTEYVFGRFRLTVYKDRRAMLSDGHKPADDVGQRLARPVEGSERQGVGRDDGGGRVSDEMKVCWNCKYSEIRGLNDGYWCYVYEAYKNAIEDCPKWEPDALSVMTARIAELEAERDEAEAMVERLIEAVESGERIQIFPESDIKTLQEWYAKMETIIAEWKEREK